MAGHDGWLSIEHEDVMLNSLEGLEQSVALLKGLRPMHWVSHCYLSQLPYTSRRGRAEKIPVERV